MGLLPTKKLSLLLLIIIASLISISSEGRLSKFLTENSAEESVVGVFEASPLKGEDNEKIIIHERMLRKMNTQDYGRYDPSPSMGRPRHKLIPN